MQHTKSQIMKTQRIRVVGVCLSGLFTCVRFVNVSRVHNGTESQQHGAAIWFHHGERHHAVADGNESHET